MIKKMLLQRVLPTCLALAVLGGILFYLFADRADGQGLIGNITGAGPSIESDGRTYQLGAIETVPIATEISDEDMLPVVGDRETLLKLLLERGVLYDDSAGSENNRDMPTGIGGTTPGATTGSGSSGSGASAPGEFSVTAPDLAEAPMEMGLASEDGGSFSQTNEQVAGISEGDIVKTDGQFIYAMSPYGGALRIISVDGTTMEVVSTIAYDDIWGSEFYLVGRDRIAIIGNENLPMSILPIPGSFASDAPAQSAVPEAGYDYGWRHRGFTVLHIYDISDRANPVHMRRVSMDGWSVSTRVIGDIIYIVTNKNTWSIAYNQADSPSILPYCSDTLSGDEYAPIDFDRIYYIPDSYDSNYMLIGALDVYGEDPFEPTAYLGAGINLYMSHNAMYLTKYRHMEVATEASSGPIRIWSEMTDILRLAIDGTTVTYTGMGTVDGMPINQYSMDEYNGYFRIATTDWNTGTYVTVLGAADMQVVGRTEAMAPGERMQSMRFMGDMGYVVTFEMVDPLFTIDLSDPQNPLVLGELKIPGFSQYLHPVGDGLLLGIGRDTQELYARDASGVETIVGFRDIGMKVSLFDVSDPLDPLELDVLALGEGWAEVSSNPRALMSDRARGIYGFMMESRNSSGRWGADPMLIAVENGQLRIVASLAVHENTDMYSSRLCFVNDTLYLVHDAGVIAYDYNGFARLGSISF